MEKLSQLKKINMKTKKYYRIKKQIETIENEHFLMRQLMTIKQIELKPFFYKIRRGTKNEKIIN